MGVSRHFYWQTALLALSLAVTAARAQTTRFFDTTAGSDEDTSKYGGIDKSEEINLDKEHQKILKRFKDGRMSSSNGVRSRYSGILEMHDNDFDGVTDHDVSANGDPLEANTEAAALGKAGGVSGAARQKALQEAANNAGHCKNGQTGNSADPICRNISANLLDMGNAHGKADEEHRVYDLSKKAYEGAMDAGQKYGDKVNSEASNYGDTNLPPNAQAIKDKEGNVTAMRVTSGGQTNTVQVGANVDLLKSEAAWLTQQEDCEIHKQAKSMRAARLAGAESDKDTIALFANIYDCKRKDTQQQEQEAAQKIQELSLLGGTLICDQTKGASKNELYTGSNCKDGSQPGSKNQTSSLVEFNRNFPGLSSQMWAAAKQKAMGSGPPSNAVKKDMAKIQKCLDLGTWCSSPGHADQNGDYYNPVKGDAGNAYSDTREYIMSRLYQARQGGLDKFESTMKSADFNDKTDAKTNNQPYKKMVEQIREAQRAAAIVNGKQYNAVRAQGRNSPNFKDPYTSQTFNTQTMTTQQLFGRNASRDGTTLLSNPMPVGDQGGGADQGNSGGSFRQPATPPSSYTTDTRGSGVAAPTSNALPGRNLIQR
ncbi:MAG: hypothetical protein JST16_01640 [Bdellovibrionales bacterium]|nr:hypothetical protein [Bdellovibrionales bacterium]